jgi:hypothetical protein
MLYLITALKRRKGKKKVRIRVLNEPIWRI